MSDEETLTRVAEQEAQRDEKTLSRTVGGASMRRQNAVNLIIFAVVVISFGAGLRLSGVYRFIAIDIGIVLVSVKLAYFFHNNLRMNHYMFWVHMAFEHRLLAIEHKLNQLVEASQPPGDKPEPSPPGDAGE